MIDMMPSDPTGDGSGFTEKLARLLFALFIHMTDDAEVITPCEIERLHRLLNNVTWTQSQDLRLALGHLRGEYCKLWQAYNRKDLLVGVDDISFQLASLLTEAGADGVEKLQEPLRQFVEKIGRGSSWLIAGLGLAADDMGPKAEARKRIETLLELSAAPVSPAGATTQGRSSTSPATQAGAFWPACKLELSETRIWKGDSTRVRCVNVINATHDVKTYTFVTEPLQLFQFSPGQFITLELPIGGKIMRRSYTISSSPSRPHALSITVKRVAEGTASNWLYDNMTVGRELKLSGPHGTFSCFTNPSEKLLFIAGGSGVTPIMSMLRWLCDTCSPCDVVLINNVRTPADIIFERELYHIASSFAGKLTLGIVPGLVPSGQAWNGITGTMNEELLRTYAPDFAERETFVCGPAGYMIMVKEMLERLGHSTQRFHQESFGGGPASAIRRPAQPAIEPGPGGRAPVEPSVPIKPSEDIAPGVLRERAMPSRTYSTVTESHTLFFGMSKQEVRCGDGDIILDLAELNGIEIASACRAGVCGTCKVRKVDGEIQMPDQSVLSEEDLREGYILACISQVQGDVTIHA